MEILLKVDTLVLIYSRYKSPELKEKKKKTTTTTLLLFRNVIGMLSRQVTKVIELIYYIKMIFSKRNSIPLKEKKKKVAKTTASTVINRMYRALRECHLNIVHEHVCARRFVS